MGFVLSKEQQLIRQNARDFARQYLEPIKKQLDESGEYPASAVRAMAEQDFFALFLPADYAGAEAGFISYVLVLEELARVCAAAAAILKQSSLAAYAINRWGSAAQKKAYLPALAAGEKLAGVALSETGPAIGVGPDALIATRQEAGYLLKGRKSYVGNAGVAGVYVVVASTDASTTSLTAFLVDANAAGLSVGPAKHNLGLHGFPTADIVFNDVLVPDDRVLGAANCAQEIVTETIAVAGVADAAQTIGITQAAIEEATEYSRQRVQFGQPIANFEAIQSMLAEMATHAHLLRLATCDAARLIEQGEPFLTEAAMVRWFAARVGPDALIQAVQVEGGYGYIEEGPLPRLYRDAWGATILEHPADFPERIIAGE